MAGVFADLGAHDVGAVAGEAWIGANRERRRCTRDTGQAAGIPPVVVMVKGTGQRATLVASILAHQGLVAVANARIDIGCNDTLAANAVGVPYLIGADFGHTPGKRFGVSRDSFCWLDNGIGCLHPGFGDNFPYFRIGGKGIGCLPVPLNHDHVGDPVGL
ncbi:MAG: hypothetical protein U9R25_00460 [Chloroflexota bacterium]|nr:hypothetical protein [Chloroflexota bacterium]